MYQDQQYHWVHNYLHSHNSLKQRQQQQQNQEQEQYSPTLTRNMGNSEEDSSMIHTPEYSRRLNPSTRPVKDNHQLTSTKMRCQQTSRRRRQQSTCSSLSLIMVCAALIMLCPSSSLQLDESSPTSGAATAAAVSSVAVASNRQQQVNEAPQSVVRSTQPTVDRQVDTPNSSPVVSTVSQAPAKEHPAATNGAKSETTIKQNNNGNNKPAVRQVSASHRKSALASFQNYDKYQLKATNSHNTTPVMPDSTSATSAATSAAAASSSSASSSTSGGGEQAAQASPSEQSSGGKQDESVDKNKVVGASLAHKKSGQNGVAAGQGGKQRPSFSLLKKFLPAFMTSTGPMAAAAAAAAASVADKSHNNNHHHHQVSSSHSRSSQSLAGDGPLSKASGKIINLLSSKKSGYGLVPDHAPFFVRKPSIDRQAGFASGLLSNPLSLGLLFSAPLIPSLLLTPLAIAGLSPAMSAINNFFGDDEETGSTPASSGPLSVLTGASSPLSSILQGNSQGSSPSSSLAMQAVQSFLGPPATTEKPLFNPGMFASQGIQSAMGSMSSGSSSPSSSSSTSAGSSGGSSSSSPIRNFLGGNSLIQTAASMISPSFAAPPSSSSSQGSSSSNSDSDDGPGFMQVASDVFDKVANYMNPDRDVAQAAASTSSISTASGPSSSSGSSSSGSSASPASALSTLVGLSNFSPFQLSSLFASSPLASAMGFPSPASSSGSSGSSGSSSSGGSTQRAGFFSTLKNFYELFSSSFLRRQEVGDSNECQQRLICELHQRAMNSKLFRRSVQANLMELANFDKSLQEQIRLNPFEARVDADTKAMLSDFLKATNNFKNGRELVNCSKMFPRCSRTMLLSAANAHLTDPANSKAIGKFSQLMKKMKFKSNQQHQSQWKLRKPTNKLPVNQQIPRAVQQTANGLSPLAGQYQASDYLQVAPLSPIPASASGKVQPGQLTPADSLKLVQQIMLMSQQQQQLQQQQPSQLSQSIPLYPNNNNQQQVSNMQQSYGQQMYGQTQPALASYQNYAQYPGPQQQQQQQQQMSNTYTDAIAPVYSSTDSPIYSYQSQQQLQQQHQVPSDLSQPRDAQQQQQPQQILMQHEQHQVAPQQQQQQQLNNNYQQYPTSTSTIPEHIAGSTMDNKKVQLSGGSSKVIAN